MPSDFENHGGTSPIRNGVVVAPGPDPLPFATRGIYVGGTGDVTATLTAGPSLTFVLQ